MKMMGYMALIRKRQKLFWSEIQNLIIIKPIFQGKVISKKSILLILMNTMVTRKQILYMRKNNIVKGMVHGNMQQEALL